MAKADQPPDPLVLQRFEQVWPVRDGLAAAGEASDAGRWQLTPASAEPLHDPLGTAEMSTDPFGMADMRYDPLGGAEMRHDPLSATEFRRDPVGVAGARLGLGGTGVRALAALNPGRRAVKALAAVAAIVVVVSAFLAWRSRPSTVAITSPSLPPSVAPAPGGAALGSAPQPSATSTAVLVVAVQGKVKHPGLVRLPLGARVADAIDAAGGALPGTDLSFVNLAQKVVDGELIVVGVTPPPGAANLGRGAGGGIDGGGSAAPGSPINLNSATAAELDTLPGIGPALAGRIIDYRTQHGGFHSVDELRSVSGIGDAKFAEIKDLVTV